MKQSTPFLTHTHRQCRNSETGSNQAKSVPSKDAADRRHPQSKARRSKAAQGLPPAHAHLGGLNHTQGKYNESRVEPEVIPEFAMRKWASACDTVEITMMVQYYPCNHCTHSNHTNHCTHCIAHIAIIPIIAPIALHT